MLKMKNEKKQQQQQIFDLLSGEKYKEFGCS